MRTPCKHSHWVPSKTFVFHSWIELPIVASKSSIWIFMTITCLIEYKNSYFLLILFLLIKFTLGAGRSFSSFTSFNNDLWYHVTPKKISRCNFLKFLLRIIYSRPNIYFPFSSLQKQFSPCKWNLFVYKIQSKNTKYNLASS